MAKQSAGILMYRVDKESLEVLIVHPGGPFNSSKDEGAWSIPKGEFEVGEETLTTAIREFEEELGSKPPASEFIRLKPVTQKAGKVVHAFAVEGDLDTENVKSNTFEMEWPPRSGKMQEFPEVDRAEWFDIPTARRKLNPSQIALLDELVEKVGS
ncbi:MAG: NUDIX domain-containing protein [Chloracidobacterium sp.]|nr:NUDIX domain-containing protein [Chloracidobacterium sp.]